MVFFLDLTNMVYFLSFTFQIQSKKESGLLKPGAEIAIFKDIAGEAERLEVKETKAIMVLVELLFDANVIKQVSLSMGVYVKAGCQVMTTGN